MNTIYDKLRSQLRATNDNINAAEFDHRRLVSGLLTTQGDLFTPAYGHEFIADIHGVCEDLMTRESIKSFCVKVGAILGVELCDLHFWDDEETPADERVTDPKHVGITAIQFLLASNINITIHTLQKLGSVFVNIFTCGQLDEDEIDSLCFEHWRTRTVRSLVVDRLMDPRETFDDDGKSRHPQRRRSLLD